MLGLWTVDQKFESGLGFSFYLLNQIFEIIIFFQTQNCFFRLFKNQLKKTYTTCWRVLFIFCSVYCLHIGMNPQRKNFIVQVNFFSAFDFYKGALCESKL